MIEKSMTKNCMLLFVELLTLRQLVGLMLITTVFATFVLLTQTACSTVQTGEVGIVTQEKSHSLNESDLKSKRVRFATFNVALNRPKSGQLLGELKSGKSESAKKIAEVIQTVAPDILLINELDEAPETLVHFQKQFLEVSQNGKPVIKYPYRFTADVNTGLASQVDINNDGKIGGANDAIGFGEFHGQYSMAILSKYPIQKQQIRTFQKFLWRDLPGMKWPIVPDTGKSYYSEKAKEVFRLSSKSHWDIPIDLGDKTIHFLASHPTPPVFDGPEDRNGLRNADEIRFWSDYIDGKEYFYDDNSNRGGLEKDQVFVVAGDLNADPEDGDLAGNGIANLLKNKRVNSKFVPSSNGAKIASAKSGSTNAKHRGAPEFDTGDFNDNNVGNLRVDYVLPSSKLKVVGGAVFWPSPENDKRRLAKASDHHLVWIDIELN